MKIEEITNTTLDETDGAGDATEETVCARSVKKAKNKTLNEVRADYPDTYDFLMSLSNNLSQINHYQ